MLDLMAMHRLLEVLGGLVPVVVSLSQQGPGRPPIPDEPQAVLEHPRRREIYEMVEEQPGISGAGLQKAFDVDWGVLHNHLHRLVRAGLVETRRSGRAFRIYPAGQAPEENDPVLLPAMTKRVARAVLDAPGRTGMEIAGDVGISPKRVNEHLRRLADVGLVRPVVDGRQMRHEPTALLKESVRSWAK